MRLSLKNNSYLRIGLLIFAVYTFFFAIQVPQVYFNTVNNPQYPDFWLLVGRLAIAVYFSALMTPLILWLGYIFQVKHPNLWRNLLLHVVLSIVYGVVIHLIYALGMWVFGLATAESVKSSITSPSMLFSFIYTSVTRYAATIGIQQAYLFFRESQERALNLKQAELQMLKMQLQPHFFFNTLNAISALMYRSPKQADRMIVRLGDMFRVALKKDKTQEVSLKEEIEFLEAFLQVHQTLMGKRLQIEWRVQPETLDAAVPNLILQPLVENAIQHGIAPLEDGGRITISSARQNGHLLLQVSDDGRGFVSTESENYGIGLSNTRARLANLYNGSHKFSFDEKKETGVTVRIEIPFREQQNQEVKNEH